MRKYTDNVIRVDDLLRQQSMAYEREGKQKELKTTDQT